MRYYIIFGITIILLLIILFYNPFLGVYKDSITIDYSSISNEEGYVWNLTSDGNSLSLIEENDSLWVFKVNKIGFMNLTYKYVKDDECKYTINNKFFVFLGKIYWIKGEGFGLLDYPNPI